MRSLREKTTLVCIQFSATTITCAIILYGISLQVKFLHWHALLFKNISKLREMMYLKYLKATVKNQLLKF